MTGTATHFRLDKNELQQALAEAERHYTETHSASYQQWITAKDFMPGGNTRTSLWYTPFPLCFVSGEGSHVHDADGIRYIDFLGEFTAGIYGHSPKIIESAIKEALSQGINLSSQNNIEGKFANLIVSRFKSMELVRFTNSATEANLMAITAARAVTGREKVLVFKNAYHGGVLSFASDNNRSNAPYDFVLAPYNDIDKTAELIDTCGSELACVLVEPMLGAGGCIPGNKDFLSMLRQKTNQYGIALIFDEVQTSRLSFGGRQQQLGIYPDLTTIGKFFGGGLAFGCFGGSRQFMEIFDPAHPHAVPHSGTFNNNTLTMNSGYTATLNLLTDSALDKLNARGDTLRNDIARIFIEHNAPFTVSGLGSLMTIHSTLSADDQGKLLKLLFLIMVEHHIYLAPRGLIALSFSIDDADIEKLIQALKEFCTQYSRLWKR